MDQWDYLFECILFLLWFLIFLKEEKGANEKGQCRVDILREFTFCLYSNSSGSVHNLRFTSLCVAFVCSHFALNEPQKRESQRENTYFLC